MTRVDPNEAGALLHWMPIIVRSSGISEWERKFCASMISRQRRKGFTGPSAKQVAVMRRIVGQFREQTMGDQVIDDGPRP